MKMPVNYSRLLLFIPLILLAFSVPASAQTVVCLETDSGDICMELLETEAPVTTQNFLAYVNQGNYTESFFHFSKQDGPVYIQAGGYADDGSGTFSGLFEIPRGSAIARESSVSNSRGTVAAIADDPANPDSITSQYLINLTDNPELDGEAVVFARVVNSDLAVADTIGNFPVISLDDEDLNRVPVSSQESPVFDSPRIMISRAYIFDGSVSDLEPGEGEVLYEDAVCVDTNVGEFCMELLPDAAPNTVTNFLNYVTSGRYDDTIIHRTDPDFVIQGGGYKTSPLGAAIDKDDVVDNEFSLSNLRGTVAMARLGGVVNSATSEWFVNLVNNTQLDSVDGGFTVFAQIISGMDIVDTIGNLPRSNQQSNLGSAFSKLPLTDQDDDGIDADDLVVVNRVYITDVIISDDDDSGVDLPETTATYSTLTGLMVLPVWINDALYRVMMFRDTSSQGAVFAVDTTRIISLTDIGQEAATMDLDAGILTIPSVAVGSVVINDVVLELTDFATLTFKLSSYQSAE